MKILIKSVLMTSLLLMPTLGFSAEKPSVENQGTEKNDQLRALMHTKGLNIEVIKKFVEENPSVMNSKNINGRIPLDSALNILVNYSRFIQTQTQRLRGDKLLKLQDSGSAKIQQLKNLVAYLASRSSEEVKRATLIRLLNSRPNWASYGPFFVRVANINPLSITLKDGMGPNFEKNLTVFQQALEKDRVQDKGSR